MSSAHHILFITSSRIGDAVLSTGLLKHIAQTYPESKVTIAGGPLVKSLFEGYPNLERYISMPKQSWNRHWIGLFSKIWNRPWDMVVDMRNSVVSRFIPAGQRYCYGRHIDRSRHKVVQAADVMNLDEVPDPCLWFTPDQTMKARALIGGNRNSVIAVGPTANWIGKTWPPERFVEILIWLTGSDGFFEGASIAVFGAPGEEENAYQVLNALPHDQAINVIAKADPGTAAAALSLCDFYIGNDSGLMHCAAAAGVSTMGLFGPSYPHLYAPWGGNAFYVATPESFDTLTDFEGYDPKTLERSLMTTLNADRVKDEIQDFLNRDSLNKNSKSQKQAHTIKA